MKRFLIIDGGTTNLRVSLTDENATRLDTRRRAVGAAAAAISGSKCMLESAVKECIDEILSANGLSADNISRCIAYGMITSAGGLAEIPHLCTPGREENFRAGLVSRLFESVAPFPITFIPGLKNFSGSVTLENLGEMDMMRGEETEAVGFFRLVQPEEDCVLILPGSHNKLISMERTGAILGCMTTISGELLSALTHHTILAEAVGGQFVDPEHYDRKMLLAGAKACSAGIGRAAFSARILRTLGGLPQEKVASFLLGVALKSDVDALKSFAPGASRLYVAGKEPLQTALIDLLASEGYAAESVSSDISGRMGIVGALTIAGAAS